MKRILVTGGAGFVGSHLCERLLNEGNKVICLDNFFTGKKRKIEHLLHNPNFELVKHDITQAILLQADEIYNLACPASPVHYQHTPIETIKTSVMGAVNLLDLSKSINAKILQASTSEVYGDPTVHPQPESYWGNVNPIGIRSCYDEGKRCAESLFVNYHAQYNLRIKIIRIFNTYGPNMEPDDGRVISNFIMQALKGKDLTIFGDGQQTRSFQYVTDLLDGMIAMMNTEDNFIGPVNIGNPNEFTMLELAKEIIDICGTKSQITHLPLPQDDPTQRQPDIRLAKEKLNGWTPKVELREGLEKTVAYFEQLIKKNNI